jgi:hypothetical protein
MIDFSTNHGFVTKLDPVGRIISTCGKNLPQSANAQLNTHNRAGATIDPVKLSYFIKRLMAMRRPPIPRTITMILGNSIFFKNSVFLFTSDTNESINSKFSDMASSLSDPIIRRITVYDIYKYVKGDILQGN